VKQQLSVNVAQFTHHCVAAAGTTRWSDLMRWRWSGVRQLTAYNTTDCSSTSFCHFIDCHSTTMPWHHSSHWCRSQGG